MAGTVHLYGICNCDTVKKARAWLATHRVEYQFHDYKSEGIDAARLAAWARVVGWEALLNRAGTTFRRLPEEAREGLDEARALRLMREQPSMIRRPVLEAGSTLLVGFSPEKYSALA